MATVTEFVRFANPTDHDAAAQPGNARPGMFSFMRFALPPDASQRHGTVRTCGGEIIISVGSGFALTAPVPPGEHSVDFAYTFPYAGRAPWPTATASLRAPDIFQILVPDRWDGIEKCPGIDSPPAVGIQEGNLPGLGRAGHSARSRRAIGVQRTAPARQSWPGWVSTLWWRFVLAGRPFRRHGRDSCWRLLTAWDCSPALPVQPTARRGT